MSTLYNLEPQPTAKVLLQTTSGDIVLELFAKQIPLASRNFLQHCLDGYYNGTIFHRLVPGFVIQGGDPTGTGFGGKSALDDEGLPFKDEFHSRLKYNRRGLVGMANNGRKDDNQSQFFITLGETPELTGKNTLFGRVATGDTIFNVMKMADAEMTEEGGDRPLYPTKITGAEILVNPFEDMEKRDIKREKVTEEKSKKKQKRKAGKALLSFGDDGDEEDGTGPTMKKPKFNTKLFASEHEQKVEKPAPPPKSMKKKEERIIPKVSVSLLPESKEALAPRPKKEAIPSDVDSDSDSDSDSEPPPPKNAARENMMSKAEAEIAALKASLRRHGPETKVAKEKPKSLLESMVPPTATKGRKRGAVHTQSGVEEAKSLAMFNAFKAKLEQADLRVGEHKKDSEPKEKKFEKVDISTEADEDEENICDLHFIANCQSCSNWAAQEGDDDDEVGDSWMTHQLTFEKDRLGKDLEWKRKNEEELLVVDPRERAKELGVDRVGGDPADKKRRRDGERRKDREWDKPKDRRTLTTK